MKVGLISNWDIQCGAAEYARDIKGQLEKEFAVVCAHQKELKPLLEDREVQVVIINWNPGRVNLEKDWVYSLIGAGKKVILIAHNSIEGYAEFPRVDAVVVLEDLVASNVPVHFIPHGMVVPEKLPESDGVLRVGTAGFPFPWKRPDLVAEIAKVHRMKFRFIAPKSDQMNTDTYVDGICGHVPDLVELTRSWLPKEEVIGLLAGCTFNVFWFESKDLCDLLGQSGSVRMGLAAGRPIIISRHRKLKTLFSYEDELYICDKEEEVWGAVDQILANLESAKRPKRILEDTNWGKIGAMYRDLVRKVVAEDAPWSYIVHSTMGAQ